MRHGVSRASFYKLSGKVTQIPAPLIVEMKDMAEQNRRIQKKYAEMIIQNDLLGEAFGKKRKGHLCSK